MFRLAFMLLSFFASLPFYLQRKIDFILRTLSIVFTYTIIYNFYNIIWKVIIFSSLDYTICKLLFIYIYIYPYKYKKQIVNRNNLIMKDRIFF